MNNDPEWTESICTGTASDLTSDTVSDRALNASIGNHVKIEDAVYPNSFNTCSKYA